MASLEITSEDFKHLGSETKKSKFSGEVAHVVGTERMLLFGMERSMFIPKMTFAYFCSCIKVFKNEDLEYIR